MIIEKPGLLSTIQDLGRKGYKRYGVISSGAMDQIAHRIANMLVLNEEDDETIEITMTGPEIRFQEDAVIAITGGDLSPSVNGQAVTMYRPLIMKEGDVLSFGRTVQGIRAYLAVHGGFSIEQVMHSASTYLRAGIGGYKGRALKKGDELPLKRKIAMEEWELPINWSAESFMSVQNGLAKTIRVIRGAHYNEFTEDSQRVFAENEFTVTPESDRMGYRLEGESLNLKEKTEFISEAVSFGTIQVPADGKPIILMADSQTLGGYAKLAQVASVDRSALAQAKPGDRLKFDIIGLMEAQRLLLEQEQELQILKRGIWMKHV
ncbi:5-oxoprolinase subunit C family protein [Pradoshia sp.]